MWDGLFLQFYGYQYAGYIDKMEQILSISEITPLTTEWTCKVQTVDKFRPRDSRDQRVRFQTIIVQDENFEWDVDRFTIMESIPNNNENEAPLPPPSRLSIFSFLDLEQQLCGVEFDLLAVVANCGAMQYTR
nr:uncharacterized protein LOC104113220 [Nicotiana tomentosiformis]